MLKNYLRLSAKSIFKQGHLSIITVIGLSIAMSCSILILLYTEYELSYDKYHENSDKIYRVETKHSRDFSYMGNDKFAVTPAPLKIALDNDIPEIKNATRCKIRYHTLEYNSSLFSDNVFLYADTDFLKIFTFPVLYGNPEEALAEPFSLFITERMALKYFGTEDPVGKTLKADNRYLFTVKGIIKNIPENSHFDFDFLTGFETLYIIQGGKEKVEKWGNFSYLTYFQIFDNVLLEDITYKLNEFTERYLPDEPMFKDLQWVPRPLTSIHLGGNSNFEPAKNSDIRYLYLISAIGIFILLIACVNYSNMAIARSYNRGREIGILKVSGSSRRDLIIQFIMEALLLSFAGLILATLIVLLLLPFYRDFTGRPLNFRMIFDFSTLLRIVALTLLTGLIAGIYPSFHLSSISPLHLLNGEYRNIGGRRRSGQIRNLLVIIQYIISIVALVCTFTILRQFIFIQNKDVGYIKDDILTVTLKDPGIRKNPEILLNELRRNSEIVDITTCSNLPNSITSAGFGYWEGKQPETSMTVFQGGIGDNFLNFFNIKTVSGRGFSPDFLSDTAKSIIINQETAKIMGGDDPVGRNFGFDPKNFETVVGVVKNFNFQSLHLAIEPMALFLVGSKEFPEPGYIFVKVTPGALHKTKIFIEKKLKELSPHYLNEVSILSDQVNAVYSSDRKLVTVFIFSTVLAIVLTFLGQYSLTSYTTKNRTREMAVRKVMGSQPAGIMFLLVTEMVRWIFLSLIFAWPIAYILMNRWLQNYAYHVNTGAGVFLYSLLITLMISLIAVSYYVIKLSRVNPAEIIRHE
ncbi:MAG: ABC transporter permease [Bacteroidales bacterium]